MSDDNKDYQAGYRGGQFHHGMDRGEYERGKAQKEFLDSIGGANQKVEVPGVAYTLVLVSPFLWMVYPVLGFTILAAVGAVVFLCTTFKVPIEWAFWGGIIPCFASFFFGLKFEIMASQATVYRLVRGLLRIAFSFVGITAAMAGDVDFNEIPPGAFVGGFFATVIIYLIFQRLDLIYFPAVKEIRKMQEKLKKGERPKRSLFKRMLFGFCWLIPVNIVLTLLVGIPIVMLLQGEEREAFFAKWKAVATCANIGIWYLLCLLGVLPGTGKYMFSKRHEEDLRTADTSGSTAVWQSGS